MKVTRSYKKIKESLQNSVPVFQVTQSQRMLCKLSGKQNTANSCQSNYIADSIDLFWIVCPIYSFGRAYDTLLYDLHIVFKGYMQAIGLPFITFEAIRYNTTETYRLTKAGNEPYDMQGYYHNVSYVRENLLNVAIQRLKADWEYFGWIDAHQVFENHYW